MKACRKNGFTLIEILIVVSILAVLMAVALPALTSAVKKAHITETKASLAWLRTAISAYESEYGCMPVNRTTSTDAVIETDGGDPLIYVLLGQTKDGLNPKRINYFEARVAISRRNGVSLDDSTAALHDAWGRPFHVLLDLDGDHLIANPDKESLDGSIASGASAMVPSGILIYSDGPDGKPHTRDDVVSWR
ncbi:MAG: type II secretion system GspH family protein [Verrucomicrobiaceae bacterium]|nr:type II secretion system GspH family protein [Verrucomicrobiaceae bacterium]